MSIVERHEDDEDKLDENDRQSTTVESVNYTPFTHTPETTTRFYGSINRRTTTTTTTIQTEQNSTPQTSSSYPNPSTTTNHPNTYTSHYTATTITPTQNNVDLGSELTSSTLTANQNSDHLFTTVASAFNTQTIPTHKPYQTISTLKPFDTDSKKPTKKTDPLTKLATKNPLNVSTKISSFSSEDFDKNGSVTDRSKLTTTKTTKLATTTPTTTTYLPSENPSTPTVTPSSFVIDNNREESDYDVTTTPNDQIESSSSSSSFVKPAYGGGISSPRPFSFSKRTRPTTTTTSTTQLTPTQKTEPKVSVASNQNVNEIGLNQVSGPAASNDANTANASNAPSSSSSSSFYSIANATDDEHTVNNDSNSILTTITSIDSSLSPTTTTVSPNTVHSTTVVNSASVNSRFKVKNRKNPLRVNSRTTTATPTTTEQATNSDAKTHRFGSQRRIRTRPPARNINADQSNEYEQTNPILDDDGVRHVTYNIARQQTQQAERDENEENFETTTKIDRTNVIRRRFRPKLNDLLQESSNGLAPPPSQDQSGQSYRAESDISSLTSIDFSRKRLHQQNASRTRANRRRPIRPDDSIPEESQNESQLESQDDNSSVYGNTPNRSNNRYSSQTSNANLDDSVMEQSLNIEMTDTEPPIVVPLARKINFGTSSQNRVNSPERKTFTVNKSFGPFTDSPIIFLHPSRYDRKPQLKKALNQNVVTQATEIPSSSTESLLTLGQGEFTPFLLETIESTSEGHDRYSNDRLFNQKVEEIQGIIDSFKPGNESTPTITTTTTTQAPIRTRAPNANRFVDPPENAAYLATLAKAINALNSFDDANSSSLNQPSNGSNDSNQTISESSQIEQTSTVRSSNFGQQRRRPIGRRPTAAPAADDVASIEVNGRNRLQSRRRFSSSTASPNASSANVSTEVNDRRIRLQSRRRGPTTAATSTDSNANANTRSRQPVYRGRVKNAQSTINGYSNKTNAENVSTVQNVTERAINVRLDESSSPQSVTENDSISTEEMATESSVAKDETTIALPSDNQLATESVNSSENEASTESVLNSNLSSSTEPQLPSSTESELARRRGLRRPAYRQNNNGTTVTANESPRQNVYRGRIRSQTVQRGSQAGNEQNASSAEVSRQRGFSSRRRFSSSTTETNVDAEETTEAILQRRTFSRRRFTTTTEESGSNESFESQSEIAENDPQVNRFSARRRRPNYQRTTTESNEEGDQDLNNEYQTARSRVPVYRGRPTARTSTESTEQIDENQDVDTENVNENVRTPAPRRRPFAQRNRTTAAPSDDANTENSSNESDLSLRYRLRQRNQNRFSSTDATQQAENDSSEQTNGESADGETVQRARPNYVRKKITSFNPIDPEQTKRVFTGRRRITSSTTTSTTLAPVDEYDTESNKDGATESANEQSTENSTGSNDNESSTPSTEAIESTESNDQVEQSSESASTTESHQQRTSPQNRRRIIKKLRTTTTPAAASSAEESNNESTPNVIGNRRNFRPASLRLRESRRQYYGNRGEVTNTLDASRNSDESNQQSDEQIDQDHETVERPRTAYTSRFAKHRLANRPTRPSFSLTTTTKSESAQDIEQANDQQEQSFSEVPAQRKSYQRKFSRVFKVPKAPQENVDSRLQTIDAENQEDSSESTRVTPFRPKGLRVNKFKRPTESSEATVDLDGNKVNALNVRNRKIFNRRNQSRFSNARTSTSTTTVATNTDNDDTLNTESPTTQTPLPNSTDENTESNNSANESRFVATESANDIETNTNTQPSLITDDDSIISTTIFSTDSYTENEQSDRSQSTDNPNEPVNMNSINLVDNLQESATIKPVRKYSKMTTTTTANPNTVKPTTYQHVFAIDYDENPPVESSKKHSQRPNEIGRDDAGGDPNAEVISKKVEKLAEVNRIVEVYSQQRRQTIQRSSNAKPKSQTSNLIIERLPTVAKLGEINRVTLIKLVDHQNDSKENLSSKEFVTFLTTTAAPATDDNNDNSNHYNAAKLTQEKKARQILLPDNIFSVETSTIPLEGLFQTDRSGKKLNIVYATTADDSYVRTSSPSPIFIPQTAPTTSSYGDDGDLSDTTADSVNDIHVVKADKPNTLHLNESTPPLVISLANLDSVVLSHVTSANTTPTKTKPTKANASDDGASIASSGKVSTLVDDAPHVVVEHSTVDPNLDEQTTEPIVVNTQSSYSSEITQTRVKKSQLNQNSNAPSSSDSVDAITEVSDT